MPRSTYPLHPAKFSDPVLELVATRLRELGFRGALLDPFAGVGRIHELDLPGVTTVGVEIERPYVDAHPQNEWGNALNLQYEDNSFQGIFTSPTHGNRFADAHMPGDESVRRSYTFDLRKVTGDPEYQLQPDNSGLLHWGPRYWDFHRRAYTELTRVLEPDGPMILVVKNFQKNRQTVQLTDWHKEQLLVLGYKKVSEHYVPARGMRFGQNHEARAENEVVFIFSAPA